MARGSLPLTSPGSSRGSLRAASVLCLLLFLLSPSFLCGAFACEAAAAAEGPGARALGAKTDPWLPSLDLAIPESHDTRKTVYDVLKEVEDTPNDNLLFAVARDVVNTYQLTKPFFDEFLRLHQQSRAKQKAKNNVLAGIDPPSGANPNGVAATAAQPLASPLGSGAESRGDREDGWKKKKARRDEREGKKHQERKKKVQEAGTPEQGGEEKEKTHRDKPKLLGYSGTSRLLS
ncbi:hypothetical protein BESB_030080 [Besnoitia besnoiti]|uniref:Transmembrane protein n=1 Tax=Besnoitia besnoiti TaxID=94643 RepID=A0A2A9M1L6_BESBE|nr:hypothetical protein BESB_030080 [Besnoitia besnoiti]PFH31134.1 hypothetical protein BESB_030080 [Besnoitia besnoiti]